MDSSRTRADGRSQQCGDAMREGARSSMGRSKCTQEVLGGQNGVPGDLTLHGLRVTFPSVKSERGTHAKPIAAMIGDKTEAMGSHYARGADTKAKIIRLFGNAE